MRKMNVLMFLVLLFCYLMAGGCARAEEPEIEKGGIVMSTLVKTGEDLSKNIQREGKKKLKLKINQNKNLMKSFESKSTRI